MLSRINFTRKANFRPVKTKFNASDSPGSTPPWSSHQKSGSIVWKIALGTLVAGFLLVLLFKSEKKKQKLQDNRYRSAGTAQIGGNWSMVDHHGHPVSRATYSGKYVLLYFGFTFCPDICPEELRKMKIVINELDRQYGEIIQPLFVSLDPWRDSIDQLAGYVKQFSPRLIGITGTPKQCEIMGHNFRVYSASDMPETVDSDADYVVDHSIFMYLMDEQGNFVEFFAVDKEPDQIVESIVSHLIVREVIKPSLRWRIKEFFSSSD